MSLSTALYRSYSELYDRFGTDVFSFEGLRRTLGASLDAALKHASLLRSRGYLVVFGREGRSRIYRLYTPEQALFAHLHMRNLDLVSEQRYNHLLIESCMQLRRSRAVGLVGVWLFGSVARGEARQDSDVDLIAVTKGVRGNRAEMTETVYSQLDVDAEREFLYRNGVVTDVSIIPFDERDLGRFYPMMLDVMRDGIVLLDTEGKLARAAENMRRQASLLGFERVSLRRGWAWVVPPDVEVGEPLEVQQDV